jgi:hypothetical protein
MNQQLDSTGPVLKPRRALTAATAALGIWYLAMMTAAEPSFAFPSMWWGSIAALVLGVVSLGLACRDRTSLWPAILAIVASLLGLVAAFVLAFLRALNHMGF